MDWNLDSSATWSALFGLVYAPLFDKQRAKRHHGTHAVLLDGSRASFTLSSGDVSALEKSKELLSWSWSAHVTHSLIIDLEQRVMVAKRWDAPGKTDERDLRAPEDIAEIIASFEKSPFPSAKSVIERTLEVFGMLRQNIEDQGGGSVELINAFNLMLLWSRETRRGNASPYPGNTLEDLIRNLPENERQTVHALMPLSNTAKKFPIGNLIAALIEEDPDTSYILDPDLLIRHASGALYQEAHKELIRSPRRRLFFTPTRPKRINRTSPKFTHFTPPPLARFLVQRAIACLYARETPPKAVRVLDPACGAGAFLIEALHELGPTGTKLSLRGLDISEVSTQMARFALSTIEDDDAQVDCESAESLEGADWGTPDLIVMNPPFLSWADMDEVERERVRRIMGRDRYHGRSDLAFAFLSKALDTLKPGAVLATIIPSSFLNSEAAAPLRKELVSNATLRIVLVGHFRGFQYFTEAMVEPSFLVVERSATGTPMRATTFVTADKGHEDRAIRAMRMSEVARLAMPRSKYIHINTVQLAGTDEWHILPQPTTAERLASHHRIEAESRGSICTAGELFEITLGIRPGYKPAFMIDEVDIATLAPTHEERKWFRPVADKVESGRIIPSEWLFFPYDSAGRLAITSERQLALQVPSYYRERLLPNKAVLESRKSHNAPWWALARSRAMSIPRGQPRLVSKAFGLRGAFAFDAAGEFVVVQGVAWTPRQFLRMIPEVVLAYLAILNSKKFESLVQQSGSRVQGGQFELYKKRVKLLPLPDFSQPINFAVMRELAALGKRIDSGTQIESALLEELSQWAYGGERPHRIPKPVDIAEQFEVLATKWQSETSHLPTSRRLRHPAYKSIVEFGPVVVPLLLKRLEQDQDDWYDALTTLTGAQPVGERNFGDIEKTTEAWIRWGKKIGYTW